MKFRKLIITIVFIATASLIQAAPPLTYFLRLDGVDGESKDKDHKAEIVLSSFSWGGVANAAVSTREASKVSIGEIKVTKPVDTSSPKLMLSCVKGSHIKEGTITVRKSNGNGNSDYLVIKLKDIIVTSFQTSGDGDYVSDNVTLTFSSLTLQAADGSSGEVQADPIVLE